VLAVISDGENATDHPMGEPQGEESCDRINIHRQVNADREMGGEGERSLDEPPIKLRTESVPRQLEVD
jgi:hypothetical protein